MNTSTMEFIFYNNKLLQNGDTSTDKDKRSIVVLFVINAATDFFSKIYRE